MEFPTLKDDAQFRVSHDTLKWLYSQYAWDGTFGPPSSSIKCLDLKTYGSENKRLTPLRLYSTDKPIRFSEIILEIDNKTFAIKLQVSEAIPPNIMLITQDRESMTPQMIIVRLREDP